MDLRGQFSVKEMPKDVQRILEIGVNGLFESEERLGMEGCQQFTPARKKKASCRRSGSDLQGRGTREGQPCP